MLSDHPTSRVRKFIKKCVAHQVWSGPFAGMRYTGNACCSNLLPKVLGTYEKEIASVVTDLVKRARGAVIDVGCAEGYYAIGALILNPAITVIAYDSDEQARDTCVEVATRNNVRSRLTIMAHCTSAGLLDALQRSGAGLVIMDIEGAELRLLTELGGAQLKHVSLVVEVHESFCPGAREGIRSAFQETHTVTEVVSRRPEASDLELAVVRAIARSSSYLEYRLLFERGIQMSWLILQPRTNIT